MNHPNISNLMHSTFAAFLFTFFFPQLASAYADTGSAARNTGNFFTGSFFAFGLNDRPAHVSNERFRISYFNHAPDRIDTFLYRGAPESSEHLVNLQFSLGIGMRYGGFRADAGLVPFANRNAHQSLSLYGLIPVHRKVCLSPSAGYTRFRKQKRIGILHGKNDSILFKGEIYPQLSVRAVNVFHSFHTRLGVFIYLAENISLNLDARYHFGFRDKLKVNIRAYKDDETKSWLNNIVVADQSRNYFPGDREVDIRNAAGNPASSLFAPGKFTFSVQIAFALNKATMAEPAEADHPDK